LQAYTKPHGMELQKAFGLGDINDLPIFFDIRGITTPTEDVAAMMAGQ
jgi:hypothetical protein